MTDDMLTLSEVATRLRLHRNTVAAIVRRGRLAVVLVSDRSLRVLATELDRYIEARTTRAQETDRE